MRKGRSGIVLLGILALLFLFTVSWLYISHESSVGENSITGNSVKEAVGYFYETSSINQRLFILSQIVLFFVVVVVIFIVISKLKPRKIFLKGDYAIKANGSRSRTDLDVLYEMLKVRKEIDMEDIERIFKVKPNIAIEWSKVLENGELAEIDYPRFSRPILRLVEEKVESKDILKENEINIKRETSDAKSIIKKGKLESKSRKKKDVIVEDKNKKASVVIKKREVNGKKKAGKKKNKK